jgi:hypothetical protein
MLPLRSGLPGVALAAVFGLSATGAAAECTCRAGGRDFSLGASTCLATPAGPRLAICDMVLNNTSWRFSSAPCPAAQSEPDADIAGSGPQRTAAAGRMQTAP